MAMHEVEIARNSLDVMPNFMWILCGRSFAQPPAQGERQSAQQRMHSSEAAYGA
jgi:hypothetical protein